MAGFIPAMARAPSSFLGIADFYMGSDPLCARPSLACLAAFAVAVAGYGAGLCLGNPGALSLVGLVCANLGRSVARLGAIFAHCGGDCEFAGAVGYHDPRSVTGWIIFVGQAADLGASFS